MSRWRAPFTLEKSGLTVYAHRLAKSWYAQLRRLGDETHLPGVTGARIEAGIVITRHIPVAAHQVVNVIAECRGIGSIHATAEAKLSGRNIILEYEKIGQLEECHR